MTKKDLKQVEKIVEKILDNMIHEVDPPSIQGYNDKIFSIEILERMEDYLGYPIDFMGIS